MRLKCSLAGNFHLNYSKLDINDSLYRSLKKT